MSTHSRGHATGDCDITGTTFEMNSQPVDCAAAEGEGVARNLSFIATLCGDQLGVRLQ